MAEYDSYAEYVGTNLNVLPAPAAVIDRAAATRNCKQMLSMCDSLGVLFRAHIKTHKTAELASLQVDASSPASERSHVSLVVSTTLEAFHVLGMLKQAQLAGKTVSVLFGIPLVVSRIPDLVRLAKALGPDSVAVMIDHPAQLDALRKAAQSAATYFCPHIFIKIDTGYGRAGVPSSAESPSLKTLCEKTAELQKDGLAKMLGFYSHGGHSYAVDGAADAFEILSQEVKGLGEVLPVAEKAGLKASASPGKGFVLSVGATPTIKSAWLASAKPDEWKSSEAYKVIEAAQARGDMVEFHAGNYPCLDMQQIATGAGLSTAANTHAQPSSPIRPTGLGDVGYMVLAEVNSSYSERAEDEALVNAGCLALGREPCKSYSGWGVVSDWPQSKGLTRGSGWYVYAISQEHGRIRKGEVPGVQTAEGTAARGWNIGDRLLIWPNHACISAANFPVMFVVDSEDESGGNVVKEVWKKCRGW